MDPGGLSPPPDSPLQDLVCKLGLWTILCTYLVSTVSIFCSMSYYFLSGGQEGEQIDEEYPSVNAILSFDKTEESWQPAGQMTVSRYKHAVEVSDHISQYCP